MSGVIVLLLTTVHKSFPLPSEAAGRYEDLRKMVEKSFVTAIDGGTPFKVETDASEVALKATLSQDGKTVALFSCSLQGSELNHTAIEKEALNIEAV